jgi:hypothetical protein
LAPLDAGQMSRTTLPNVGIFASTWRTRPVATSTPVLVVMWPNGFADSISPVLRSSR